MLPNTDMSDTDKKIIMKDHDILVALYALFQQMSQRFDEYTKSNDAILSSMRGELKAVSDNEIRLDGRMKALEQSQCDLQGHVDKLQAKNGWLDAAGIIGVIIAGVIAWFH